LAKKNPKKIFLSLEDGGSYEKIFSSDLTAEKMIIAHEIKTYVDDFVRRFSGIHRKVKSHPPDKIREAYRPVLGEAISAGHSGVIHQVMAQCSLFLCGTIFRDLAENQKRDVSSIPPFLATDGSPLIQMHLLRILEFAKDNKDKADGSWPVLLKSNAFFNYVSAYISGIRKGNSI
jgi:hypothetical protein